jgi:TolA-binding protein
MRLKRAANQLLIQYTHTNMRLLLTFLIGLSALFVQAQTTTEVITKGDTIVVRSTTIDEVATTPEQVDQVVSQLTEAIQKAESQLVQYRAQLADMHRVQALVHDRKRSLQNVKAPQSSNPDCKSE